MKKDIKTEKSYTKQKSLSKAEFELIEKAKASGFAVIDATVMERLTGYKKVKVYQLFNSLKRKGFLKEIIKGRYSLEADAFYFANYLIWPSYISFWTALSYHHLTEQLPRTIFLVNTRKRMEISFDSQQISFVKFSPRRFFGYERMDNIVIAEKEKAIIDSILFPRYAGGIAEVFKCLRNGWNEISRKKLIDYAIRIENKSVLRRLGFLIDKGKLEKSENLLNLLQKKIGEGSSKLDPFEGKGKYDKKWKIIENVDEKEIFSRGVF